MSEVTVSTSDATTPTEMVIPDFVTPPVEETPSVALIPEEMQASPVELTSTNPEVSSISEVSTDVTSDTVFGSLGELSTLAETSAQTEAPAKDETPESLDDKITEFVSELEGLKAEDEALLKEKEAAIAELEKETSALEKEVRKIHAEEKKIDTAIGSLTGKTK